MQVVAVNILPASFSLDEWIGFWKSRGAGDVVWGQDRESSAVRKFLLLALGTEIIVDREGGVAFRSDGPADHQRLRAEIDKLLSKN